MACSCWFEELWGINFRPACKKHDELFADPAISTRTANSVFYDVLIRECECPRWLATMMWLAVSTFGYPWRWISFKLGRM